MIFMIIAIFNFFFINECVTNEPQGTSAGRLIFIGITSGRLCGGERSTDMQRVQIIDSSARSRRLEVENGRAQERHARGLSRPFFFAPTTSKRLLRRLIDRRKCHIHRHYTLMLVQSKKNKTTYRSEKTMRLFS